MVEDSRKDIYSRDVSARETIELIFRHRIYTCQPEYLKSASAGRYFAPYFTAAAAETFEGLTVVPVPQGISYVSSIGSVQLVGRNGIADFLRPTRGPSAKEIQALVRSHHPASAKEILVMELGHPYQLFHPAVTKRQLGIKGSMGSQSFSLERLLQAANAGAT